ncbi:hypothetical protein Tco_1313795 [Tanacetum coccineum]
MDSMIPTGQKNTLAEYMILSGADNHPPIEHERMILESVEHGLLIWPTIEENGVTMIKKYVELSPTKKIQAELERRQIITFFEGISLNKQERECKLYDPFDKFTHIKGESLHQYYLRFNQLMNDINIYNIKLEQFQVNTKFLNGLPPEWSKFVTDVKLVKDLHTTNFDQLHAYIEQHELRPNEACLMHEHSQDPLALFLINRHTAEFPQIDSGLAVPVFKQGDNSIDAINKMMSFLSTVGRQNSYVAGTLGTRANTSGIGGNYSCQQRVMKCFNYQGEGNGKGLNEEGLEFLADPGIAEGPVTQSIITHNATYQADDLDAYNSDYDEISTAKAVLMANLSSYKLDVLSEYLIESQNAAAQDIYSSLQQDALILSVFEQLSNQVTNCNKVNNDNLIANETLSTELERYKERVKLLEERQNVDLGTREKLIIDDIIQGKNAQFTDFEKDINNLKQTLSEQSKEKELLTKTFNVFKNECKEKEAKNIDTEIALERKLKN